MSQSDILEVLKRYKKPMSRQEIASELEDDVVHISHSLKRLINSNCVKIIEINRMQALKYYNCKRRLRLYYI